MFEDLSRKLDGVLGRFRQRGLLTEPMIRDGLREVRRALLEADVNFRVTRDFLNRVREKAMGRRVLKSVSPGQQIVKIVHDELARLFGSEGETGLTWSSAPPTVIMLVGLQGSGKTSTAAKLARRLARQGRRPLLAACDLHRPAAVDQLRVLGRRAGVPVHHEDGATDPVEVARASHGAARRTKAGVLIVDTAGRLQIDEPLMDELARIKEALDPRENPPRGRRDDRAGGGAHRRRLRPCAGRDGIRPGQDGRRRSRRGGALDPWGDGQADEVRRHGRRTRRPGIRRPEADRGPHPPEGGRGRPGRTGAGGGGRGTGRDHAGEGPRPGPFHPSRTSLSRCGRCRRWDRWTSC